MAKDVLETLSLSFSAPIRRDTLEGRPHLVVPTVIITEGVHNGSGGPLLYRSNQLAKTPATWDHKPIVVYHPEINGQAVSACKKEIIEERKVGIMLNTMFDDKLRTEAWLDEEKLIKVDKRVMDDLGNNTMIEVSSGVFTDNQDQVGDWYGKPYVGEATNLRADHLAILPDLLGACSIADGAGLLQTNSRLTTNQKSWGDISSELRAIIEKKFGYSAYLEDVFDGWFVFIYDGGYWRLNYTSTDVATTVDGLPTRVFYVSQYKAIDGSVLGNTRTSLNERTKHMDRKEAVNKLIGNNGWKETDRQFLTDMSQERFDNIATSAPAPVPTPTPAPAPAINKEVPAPTPTPAPVVNKDAPKQLTEEEYIAAAPTPALRDALRQSVSSFKAEKAHHIGIITANKLNVIPAATLETMDIEVLRGMSKMAAPVQEAGSTPPVNNWAGAGGGAPPTPEKEVEPLVRPVFNSREAAKARGEK